MAKMFLNLRNVPDDEADEVRAMLDEHGIAFHETPPSPWGISAGGLWISDPGQLPQARHLMAGYQAQRKARALAAREAEQQAGTAETFAGSLRSRPLYVLAVLAAIVFIIALTLALPFLLLR